MTASDHMEQVHDNGTDAGNGSVAAGIFLGLGVFLSIHAVWISAMIMESFINPITIAMIALLLWLGFYSVREMLRRRTGFTKGFLATFGLLMLLFGLWTVIGIP